MEFGILFVLFSLIATPDQPAKEVGETQLIQSNNWHQEFIGAIESGFNTDLTGKPNAKWLGSGQLVVTHLEASPKVKLEWCEGRQIVASKISFEEIKKLRDASPVISRTIASWAAWIDDRNMINMVISSSVSREEAFAIRALQNTPEWSGWDDKIDWNIDNLSSIGPYFTGDIWFWKTPSVVAHLSLGESTRSNSFASVKKKLSELRILQFIE